MMLGTLCVMMVMSHPTPPPPPFTPNSSACLPSLSPLWCYPILEANCIFHHLCWNFGKYGIPTYFKPTNTLQQLLVTSKDPISKENVVEPVYKIKCEECDAMYIGKMERSLKSRFNEHRRHSSTTSKIAKHIYTWNNPCIRWNWRTLKSWQQNPDGLKEGWRRPFISEPWTQASTEMVEGTICLQYGITL